MRVQNIKRSSIWKIRLSTATMTLIPAAVGINYVAKAFAEGLKLPVWLGTLGTFLASMLAGPVAGQLSGLADTVADEIAFDLINQGVPADQIKRRVLNVADQLGLGDQLNQSPGTLSGGQKQRLAIATAIVTDPSILVLDDPTSEMDPLGRQHFFSWLVSVEKKTIFIVSNEVDDLCEIADQIWVLKAGELVAAGKPLTVFNHLKPDWQLDEPTVFRLAKLMKWSIPGAADEFPVTNQQLEEAYYAAN